MDIIILFFFIQKIKKIALEKDIKPGKWIGILIATWFGVELSLGLIGLSYVGIEGLYKIAVPILLVTIASAFIVLDRLKKTESETSEEIEDNSEDRSDEDFKHFR